MQRESTHPPLLVPALAVLIALNGCSSAQRHETAPSAASDAHRTLAGLALEGVEAFQADLRESGISFRDYVTNIAYKIFYARLAGQTFLEEFDRNIGRAGDRILESPIYAKLLATHAHVDELQEQIKTAYIHAALTASDPKSQEEERHAAQEALDELDSIFGGTLRGQIEIPKGLIPWFLESLTEKQEEIHRELTALRNSPFLRSHPPHAHALLARAMNQVEDARKTFEKRQQAKTLLDRRDFVETINDLERKTLSKDDAPKSLARKTYQLVKNRIEKESRDFRLSREDFGRSPDQQGPRFYPSIGPAGDITGNEFPKGVWAITYDDGPGGQTSSDILQNLSNQGMTARFFMLARQVDSLPGISQAIADPAKRMDIASHSYTHANLGTRNANLYREIIEAKNRIEGSLGRRVRLFRLPYGEGRRKEPVRQTIQEAGLIHVFWNVDTLDWQDKNPASILERAKRQIRAIDAGGRGGIVLFHDIHRQTVTASNELMTFLKSMQAKVCTTQAIVDQLNGKIDDCANPISEPTQ